MTEQMIIDAYCKIRTIDNTIPDDVLDFMKNSALEKLKATKTKVVKQYREDGTLELEYEVLESDESIKHGFRKSYRLDSKTILYETTYVNNKEHGECKWYNEDGTYDETYWYFEGEFIGLNKEGQKEFERLSK